MTNPINSLLRHVLSYGIHLVLVAVAGWAAKNGFHISVPVLPASLATWSIFGFVRLLAHNVGRSLANGKLEAQVEAQGKTFVSEVINDVTTAASGK